MKNLQELADVDDARIVWIGYPDVAAPDRFAVADEDRGLVFVYVPLDVACRWKASGQTQGRKIALRFRTTAADQARLSRIQSGYKERAAVSLDQWDHTPRRKLAA